MITKIEVLGRMNALQYSFKANIPDSIIISISEPSSRTPCFDPKNERIKDVLPLFFDDIIKEEWEVAPTLTLMQPTHVEAIKAFLDKHKTSDYKLIVHCHAGISRSSAVAAASALYLGLTDDFVWSQYYYDPNRYVFNLMIQELGLQLTAEAINTRYEANIAAYDNFLNRIEKEDSHE